MANRFNILQVNVKCFSTAIILITLQLKHNICKNLGIHLIQIITEYYMTISKLIMEYINQMVGHPLPSGEILSPSLRGFKSRFKLGGHR